MSILQTLCFLNKKNKKVNLFISMNSNKRKFCFTFHISVSPFSGQPDLPLKIGAEKIEVPSVREILKN